MVAALMWECRAGLQRGVTNGRRYDSLCLGSIPVSSCPLSDQPTLQRLVSGFIYRLVYGSFPAAPVTLLPPPQLKQREDALTRAQQEVTALREERDQAHAALAVERARSSAAAQAAGNAERVLEAAQREAARARELQAALTVSPCISRSIVLYACQYAYLQVYLALNVAELASCLTVHVFPSFPRVCACMCACRRHSVQQQQPPQLRLQHLPLLTPHAALLTAQQHELLRYKHSYP